MRTAKLLTIVMTATCGALPAQQSPKQEVQLAAVKYLAIQLDTSSVYKTRAPRVLAPEVLRVRIDGVSIDKNADAAPRSDGETAGFATRLGAQIATAADTLWCRTGECHGTRGVQIRLGDPVIVGDSAVIVYSFRARGNDERGLVPRAQLVALFLKKRDGEWQPTKRLPADSNTLTGVPGPPPARNGGGSPM